MASLLDQVKAARRVSTPLLAILTPDPGATIQTLQEGLEGGKTPIPLFRWDIVNGLLPVNKPGAEVLSSIIADPGELRNGTQTPSDCLALATRLPGEIQGTQRGSLLFVLNAQRYLDPQVQGSAAVAQAVWNLRDLYKGDRRTCILLGPQMKLPPELAQDVIVLDEALPENGALTAIVQEQMLAADLPALDPERLSLAVDAIRGLPAFTAEQVTAMSIDLDAKTLDLEALWARKRSALEQNPGLVVARGTETVEDIGGLETIKKFGLKILTGRARPRILVVLDEVEKMLGGAGAGSGGDTSGVSQDFLGVILREMEDNDWTGFLSVGPAGSGKTLIAKALGNSAEPRIMTTTMDLGAMKGSLVGQSEAAIRQNMKAIKAVAGRGGALFVATCNRLESLPPELRRRFRLGIWFFDLPEKEERGPIWKILLKRYELSEKDPRPDDTNWTGADIRNVCDIAWRLKISLQQAAAYIVPVAKSNPEAIDALRRLAAGRFLSASKPGVYQMGQTLTESALSSGGIQPLSGAYEKEARRRKVQKEEE